MTVPHQDNVFGNMTIACEVICSWLVAHWLPAISVILYLSSSRNLILLVNPRQQQSRRPAHEDTESRNAIGFECSNRSWQDHVLYTIYRLMKSGLEAEGEVCNALDLHLSCPHTCIGIRHHWRREYAALSARKGIQEAPQKPWASPSAWQWSIFRWAASHMDIYI